MELPNQRRVTSCYKHQSTQYIGEQDSNTVRWRCITVEMLSESFVGRFFCIHSCPLFVGCFFYSFTSVLKIYSYHGLIIVCRETSHQLTLGILVGVATVVPVTY